MTKFQSTHPVWDATLSLIDGCTAWNHFNPRIPYGMRLALHVLPSVLLLNFNPRIPYGMRLVSRIYIIKQDLFQSTHPVWDAT